MALADTARLVASLELKDEFSRTASKFDRTLGGMERRTSTLSRVGQEAGRGLRNTAHNLTLLGAAAGALLVTQVKAGIDSLTELAEANAQTAARIESTGGAANITAEAVRDLSQALEEQTTIDDKAIQRGQNMLLTFTNIRNEVGKGNDIFNQATESVLDLATAMGTEPEQAALQLGKALNDPIRGLTALRRVGIQFTEDQEAQIRTMVESGRVMDAQKVILAELNKEFGGSAQAFAEGPGAAMRRFGDAVEEGQQALARGLLPVIERFSKMAQDAFANPAVIAGIEQFGQGLGEGIEQLVDIASKLPWAAIGDSLKVAGTGARAVLTAFTSLPPWVQTAVLTGWGLNKLTGGALGNIVGELGKGLIRGVLNMNAAVVNINAANVRGGGGPAGGAKGGIPGWLGGLAGAGSLAGAVALISGIAAPFIMFNLIPGLVNAPPARRGGLAHPETTSFTAPTGPEQAPIVHVVPAGTAAMWSGLMPGFSEAAYRAGVREITDTELRVADGVTNLREETRFLHRPTLGIERISARSEQGIERVRGEVREMQLRTQERLREANSTIRSTAAQTAQHLRQIESVERITGENVNRTTSTLERKNFSPKIDVGVNVNTSIAITDVQRRLIQHHVATDFRGGLSIE